MKMSTKSRRRPSQGAARTDPTTLLRRYAIKLFDKKDGRAVDWPKVAEAAFKVAFSCLDETPGDERARTVARRVHDGAYNRLVDTPDNGTPYLRDVPRKPPFEFAVDQCADLEFER